MICKECGAQIADDQRFCGNCGASMEGKTDSAETVTMDRPPKNNNILKISVGIGVAAVVIIAVVLVAFFMLGSDESPSAPVDTSVSEQTEEQNAEIEAVLSEAEASATEKEYEDAIKTVREALQKYPEDKRLQDAAENYAEELKIVRLALIDKQIENNAFSSAETTLVKFLEEAPDDKEYLDALKKLIFAESTYYIEKGNYSGALTVLEEAQNKYPSEPEYAQKYDETVTTYRDTYAAEALTLFESGKIWEAYEKLATLSADFAEDKELMTLTETYLTAYVDDVMAKVNALAEKQDYDAAKEMLTEALKNLPDNQSFKDRKAELEQYKVVLVNTMKTINGGFTWNEGTPADPFGNTYSNAKNYAILHAQWCNAGKASVISGEYKAGKVYDHLNFTISPYTDFGQDAQAYAQVYVDGVLRFTTPYITRKSQPKTYSVDISDADFIKVTVTIGKYGCVILSDVTLTKSPDFVSEITHTHSSLTALNSFNGGFSWSNGYPTNTLKEDYSYTTNYSMIHGVWCTQGGKKTHSAEYYVNKQYQSFSMDIAAAVDMKESVSSYVKIYVDDVLIYASPAITKKTARFNTGEIDISNANYVRIESEVGQYGCIIVSNLLLKNK